MIIAKAVDPATLQVGDVITFMENGKTTVTHRIIGINEDVHILQKVMQTILKTSILLKQKTSSVNTSTEFQNSVMLHFSHRHLLVL